MPPSAAPVDRIPVSLLTGFLGAGKTTLLNALMQNPAMAGTALLINEFGEVGIDHHLVEKSTTARCSSIPAASAAACRAIW
jgi:G3E family GTPase